MGTITQFRGRKTSDEGTTGGAARAGELVAMGHLDLDCVIETVRALRMIDDQSFLDCFNRKDRGSQPPSAG
jgi:hypothetical protein